MAFDIARSLVRYVSVKPGHAAAMRVHDPCGTASFGLHHAPKGELAGQLKARLPPVSLGWTVPLAQEAEAKSQRCGPDPLARSSAAEQDVLVGLRLGCASRPTAPASADRPRHLHPRG